MSNEYKGISHFHKKKQEECLKHSPFSWRNWNPHDSKYAYKIMSTIQNKDEPVGFAARCTWVIGSRLTHYRELPFDTTWGNISDTPKAVFVQTEQSLRFNDYILPCIPASVRFALIIGDHDATTPNQVDVRYPPIINKTVWNAWLGDRRIAKIFVEHLDEVTNNSKVIPIPLGLNPMELGGITDNALRKIDYNPTSLLQRPLKVLQCDRLRGPSQPWFDRFHVHKLCLNEWKGFCESKEIGVDDFFDHIKQYPFMLCVHGGGIDPNPKAWSALLAGVIPIIQHFPGDTIYKDMPLIYVDTWNASSLSIEILERARLELAPWFENKKKRALVIEKLMSDYWWKQVEDI